FDAMKAEQVDEIGRLDRPRLARGDLERVRAVFRMPALDGAHALAVKLVEIAMTVARHVIQRDEQRRLLVVDVVANTPPHAVERRVGAEPFDRRLPVGELRGVAVGAARGVRLIAPADRIVAVRYPEPA